MSRLLSIILHKKVHATAMVRSLHTSQNTQDIPLRFHWSYTVSPRFATFDNYVFLTLGQGLSSEKNVKNLRIHCFFAWKTDLDSSDSSVKTKLWAHDSKQQLEHACHDDEINMADGSQLAIVKESYAFLKVGLEFPSFDMSCWLISWDL